MTGRSLLRRLRRDPVLNAFYLRPQVVPLLARIVLEASYDLIARSGDGGEFRLDPDTCKIIGLPEMLAEQMDVLCSVEEVGDCLARLVRYGFLVLDEDGLGMRLPLAARPTSSRKTESNRANGRSSIGRPRKDETPEAYQRRQAEERLRAAAQAGQRSIASPHLPRPSLNLIIGGRA